VVKHPGKPFADALRTWLEDGVGIDDILRDVEAAVTSEAAREVGAKHWKRIGDADRKRVHEAVEKRKAAIAETTKAPSA
jgi:hypothetical protein